jgi:hypothetical protein
MVSLTSLSKLPKSCTFKLIDVHHSPKALPSVSCKKLQNCICSDHTFFRILLIASALGPVAQVIFCIALVIPEI